MVVKAFNEQIEFEVDTEIANGYMDLYHRTLDSQNVTTILMMKKGINADELSKEELKSTLEQYMIEEILAFKRLTA